MSDFDAFKSDDGTEPPDGEHTAYLERAVLRDTKNGKAIKIEWRTTDLECWWESWHNTSGGGKGRTQQLLNDLGIDLNQLSGWDELEDRLADVEGPAYIVKVSRSSDGRFLNTAVVERPEEVQPALANGQGPSVPPQSDIPADTTGLPDAVESAVASAGGLFDDDDVPF